MVAGISLTGCDKDGEGILAMGQDNPTSDSANLARVAQRIELPSAGVTDISKIPTRRAGARLLFRLPCSFSVRREKLKDWGCCKCSLWVMPDKLRRVAGYFSL